MTPPVPVWRTRLPAFATSFAVTQGPHYAARLSTAAKQYQHRGRHGAVMSVAKSRKPATDCFRLAPSDFAFLWEECKRCFFLKAHRKLYRPRAPFPSIFGTIDLAMKLHLRGLPTHELLPAMPKGVFLCENDDAWVECKPISPKGYETSVYIRGMVRVTFLLLYDLMLTQQRSIV